uniref:WAT1-related protein n=1 Tax=Tanacetum cinerariifolium TaxID=118510 RepID=A0A6L2KTX7_TANCI|nr:WAT1-related protein At3g28050-like [Tanacetum cinerariifolium]
MVYCYAVAALILLPAPFFSYRSRVLPPVNFSIVGKTFLLAIIGFMSQILGYTGIIYSSPTLSSVISNLVPGFAFILAVIFRMETLSFSNKSTRAKLLGTIVSITGAFVVTLYKGPKVIRNLSSSPFHSPSVSLGSTQDNWALGGLLCTCQSILVALWYIVQIQVLKEYPSELTVVFFYNLIVSMLSAIVGAFTEPDSSAWRIKPDIALASIMCSGVLSSCLNNSVHAWALHIKGPLYVAMFKPLSIVIAVVMGVIFLGDNLYFGSLIGASIISIGFYTVMWGKAKEDALNNEGINVESSSTTKSPLLHYHMDEDTECSDHVSCSIGTTVIALGVNAVL